MRLTARPPVCTARGRGVLIGVALALLCPGPAHGQLPPDREWLVTVMDTRDGLPQNTVNDLLESRNGFLWVATFGGLARFDGQSFRVFDLGTEPALPGVRVMAVDETSDLRLWVGLQQSGVVVLEEGSFRQVLPREETWIVRDVSVDGSDRVWLATTRGAGFLDGEERFVRVGPPELRRAPAVAVVPDGPRRWVVYDSGTVLQVGADGAVVARIELGLPSGVVFRHVRLRGPGHLAVRMDSVVVEIEGDRIARRRLPGPSRLSGPGGTWLLTHQDLRRNPGTEGAGGPWDRAWGLLPGRAAVETGDGSIWMGTRADGLVHVRAGPVRRTRDMGEVADLAVDTRDQVWFVVCDLHVIEGPGESLTSRTVPVPRAGCVGGVETDPAGILWVRGGGFALARDDGGWREPMPFPAEGPVDGPFRSTDGRIWFRSGGRLIWWEDGAWQDGGDLSGSRGEGITAALATDDGFLFGTAARLVAWSVEEGGVTGEWTLGEALAPGAVRAILPDGEGGYWVGHYGGGISLLEAGGRVRRLSSVHGLPDNFVVGLARDLDGTIWISGNKGVYAVTPAEWARFTDTPGTRLRVLRVGPGEGMPEGSGRNVGVTSDGTLWFPTISGVAAVNPSALGGTGDPVAVVMDRAWEEGRPVSRDALSFRGGVNELALEYAAPRMVRPENVHFRYRMEGLNDGWVDVGTRREVFFTGLGPGNYAFQVQATDLESGRVSTATLPVEVVPAWYQTLLARLLTVAVVLLLAVLLIRRRIRRADAATGEARRHAEELRREIAERERVEAERNALSEQLLQARKLEAVGRLTGGIAHDFNNLLTAMLGHLDLLATEVEPESRPHIDALHASAERAGALTRGLLAFSRRSSLRPADIRVDRLLDSTRTLLAAGLPPNVKLEMTAAPGIPEIRADWASLENALVNLCLNARDALPRGGTIRVTADEVELNRTEAGAWEMTPGRFVRITVADNGTGMSPDMVERALEPFFTTKEVGKGTGLGLSMAFGFAKQSGGHLTVDSVEGQGTEVILHLPAARGAGSEDVPREPGEPLGRGRWVLLVEDEPAVREIVAAYLRDMGFRPLAVGTVDEARAALDRQPGIGIVLSDVMLPGESGFELARAVSGGRGGTGPTVILMSGGAPLQDEGVRAAEGLPRSVRFLLKPFTREELHAALEGALGCALGGGAGSGE